ncbi:MAG: histidinol dehydrogenase [Treponematales bacterium]
MAIRVIKAGAAKKTGRDGELVRAVAGIIDAVRERGEAAVLEFSRRFDGAAPDTVKVESAAIKQAYAQVDGGTVERIRFAAARVRAFALRQKDCLLPLSYTDIPGVELGHRLAPVESCGCYVPGGRYPLPSSALMSVTAAKAAGVSRVAACSPPSREHGGIHPAVLVALDTAGADEVFCMGGAQAIAAFAFGAGPVRKVDLIAGPGNRFVTEAKRQVSGEVGIDSLAGPSEALVLADETANPLYVALDLLAQAEHDADARPLLVTTSAGLAEQTLAEIAQLLAGLPTGETARQSWETNGAVYLAGSLDDAVALANDIAPEHLEVQVKPAAEREVAGRLRHYGSLFVGHYAPVALGDFVTGPNHILPTMAAARFSSGLWVGTFIRNQFQQFISEEGCRALAAPAMGLAETEGLAAHRESIRRRL